MSTIDPSSKTPSPEGGKEKKTEEQSSTWMGRKVKVLSSFKPLSSALQALGWLKSALTSIPQRIRNEITYRSEKRQQKQLEKTHINEAKKNIAFSDDITPAELPKPTREDQHDKRIEAYDAEATKNKPAFEVKSKTLEGDVYVAQILGNGRDKGQEDRADAKSFTLKDGQQVTMAAVYDGHGGAEKADYVSKNFLKDLSKALEGYAQSSLTKETIQDKTTKILTKYQEHFAKETVKKSPKEIERYTYDKQGTTANIQINIGNKLFTINMGDSPSLAIDSEGAVKALSQDQDEHRPDIRKKMIASLYQKNGISKAMDKIFGQFRPSEYGENKEITLFIRNIDSHVRGKAEEQNLAPEETLPERGLQLVRRLTVIEGEPIAESKKQQVLQDLQFLQEAIAAPDSPAPYADVFINAEKKDLEANSPKNYSLGEHDSGNIPPTSLGSHFSPLLIDIHEREVKPGTEIIICSDGGTDFSSPEELGRYLNQMGEKKIPIEQHATNLLKASLGSEAFNQPQGHEREIDNTTVVIFKTS